MAEQQLRLAVLERQQATAEANRTEAPEPADTGVGPSTTIPTREDSDEHACQSTLLSTQSVDASESGNSRLSFIVDGLGIQRTQYVLTFIVALRF